MNALGIDIGGSAIKGAIVDTVKGRLVGERVQLAMPSPSKPRPVIATVAQLVKQIEWAGPIGCTFPAIVHHGVILSAANVHPSWIGTDCARMLRIALRRRCVLLNDADAAGLAETAFGAGRNRKGLVIVITLGTGIGSALVYNGVLVPNAELGHLEIRGADAELLAAARVRTEQSLSWTQYARRVEEYLRHVEFLMSPDLFIIGGGISADHRRFLPHLKLRTPVMPAKLRNDAGIIGAALAAVQHQL